MLQLRQWLKDKSPLGEYGAAAIHREMESRGIAPCPSQRTIGRILTRRGALDGKRRVRRPPPPRGWYLPKAAGGKAEIDIFDTIEDLAIRNGPKLTIFTGTSLFAGLCEAWPLRSFSAVSAVPILIQYWETFGLPKFAQFDNDNRFAGPRQHRDSVGRVIRLCLSLGVTPVFAPPCEFGFQAAIESFNGLWQRKVWRRFEHVSLKTLQHCSERFISARRNRLKERINDAPKRRPFPKHWQLDLQKPLSGQIVFLRRTNASGEATVLGRTFAVDQHWVHRIVRAEVDLNKKVIRFYALRRREPKQQTLLKKVLYSLPNRRFKE